MPPRSFKPHRSRPASTSALNQPAVHDNPTPAAVFARFSDDGRYFALLSLAIDKHRLRVFDTSSGRCVSEHIFDTARVTALRWTQYNFPSSKDTVSEQPKRKKRRKSDNTRSAPDANSEPVIILGLSDGSLVTFSPLHGRVLRKFDHPTSNAAILALDTSVDSVGVFTIWSAGADTELRSWDTHTGAQRTSIKVDETIPSSALHVRPGVTYEGDDDERHTHILLAHHRIRFVSVSLDVKNPPKVLASFPGHASNVTMLHWQPPTTPETPSNVFASIAEGDRHVHVWALPESSSEGLLLGSLPLDADARSIAYTRSHVLAASASGNIWIFDGNLTRKKTKVAVSAPKCTISPPNKGQPAHVVDAVFVGNDKVLTARLIGGVKPIFDIVSFLDGTDGYISTVILPPVNAADLTEEVSAPGAPFKRYHESSSVAVQSSVAIGQDTELDDANTRALDGTLDVDLAELSLGQRLTALELPSTLTSRAEQNSEIDEGHDEGATVVDSAKEKTTPITLTRTLIQALHSSDARLLETCLAHTRAPLIQQTVRRLPPQLAVPLLNACVERLGRGARGAQGKGGGASAGTQRASGLVQWVKAVLVMHSGYLLTLPDLVARLAGLHATLSARIALQDPLRSLHGKLDLVLQQMELRATPVLAPVSRGGVQVNGSSKAQKVQRYVEGDSDEEDTNLQGGMDIDIEVGSEHGSVEDVELGGISSNEEYGDENTEEDEEDSEVDEDEDDDEDEDFDGDEGPRMGGFIDDEAEEASEENSEDESE